MLIGKVNLALDGCRISMSARRLGPHLRAQFLFADRCLPGLAYADQYGRFSRRPISTSDPSLTVLPGRLLATMSVVFLHTLPTT